MTDGHVLHFIAAITSLVTMLTDETPSSLRGCGGWSHYHMVTIKTSSSRYDDHCDPHLLLSRCCEWVVNNNNICWKQIRAINPQNSITIKCQILSYFSWLSAQRMTRRPRGGGRGPTLVSGSLRSWSAPSCSVTTPTCSWERRSPWGSTSRSPGSR